MDGHFRDNRDGHFRDNRRDFGFGGPRMNPVGSRPGPMSNRSDMNVPRSVPYGRPMDRGDQFGGHQGPRGNFQERGGFQERGNFQQHARSGFQQNRAGSHRGPKFVYQPADPQEVKARREARAAFQAKYAAALSGWDRLPTEAERVSQDRERRALEEALSTGKDVTTVRANILKQAAAAAAAAAQAELH